jgi:hypothetical protein
MQVARSYHGRTQVEDCLNPVNGYRGMQELKGQKPKNHMKENLKQIKSKETTFKVTQQKETEVTKVEPFKLNKFKNIESRVNNIRPATATTRKTQVAPDMIQDRAGDFEDQENQTTNIITQQ